MLKGERENSEREKTRAISDTRDRRDRGKKERKNERDSECERGHEKEHMVAIGVDGTVA